MAIEIKDSVKKFAETSMSEAKVDIDVEYCKTHGIKYQNHEVDASKVDLFNSKSNKAAFDFVMKLK